MSIPWIPSSSCFVLILIIIILNCCYPATAQPLYNSTANLSTTWTNTESIPNSANFTDGTEVRPILLREIGGPKFACGFYCNGNCTSYLFAVFIVETNGDGGIVQLSRSDLPPVIWSANRDYAVSYGAILNLTATGELVLQDADGTTVWTTNTTGKSVVGMNLTDTGNLVLFDVNKSVVWQSFDHPTDSLVPGQKLLQGQQLIPSVSSTNWTAQKDLYSLQVKGEGLYAYVGSDPPFAYFSVNVIGYDSNKGRRYVRFLNGSLSLFILSAEPNDPDTKIPIPLASSSQYMKFMPDGHLKVFEQRYPRWEVVADLFNSVLDECNYPLACGRNAVCSENQQCSCPVSSSPRIDYFRPVNDRQPNQGCSEINPLTCNSTQDQLFLSLENVYYFTFIKDMSFVSMETCKQACLNNCSCKAALFQYSSNSSDGDCHLPSELFTMANGDPNYFHYYSSAFIKVQNVRSPPLSTPQIEKRKHWVTTKPAIGSIIGSFALLLAVLGFVIFIIRKRRRNARMEEENIDEVPGLTMDQFRFSYEELRTATENFSKKLGQGGFGSVFEGTLVDSSKIAVKHLEGLGQVKKSFLAEVESIGSIHHVNLVRLRGFCAWNGQRFLVYEYMSNGSLDRWIYHGDREHVLKWECRKKIILDIAKGLAYLHEECRQKIIHLDIKPQNILLDDDFNGKVSDFGLSKLIDRNQSQVMTTIKGTPGYMAPE